MKTFAEMLPNATAEMREFVEAFTKACEQACEGPWSDKEPIDMMRATPPAKEPVSEICTLQTGMHVGTQLPPLYAWPKDKRFSHGDRVRVTKLENGR